GFLRGARSRRQQYAVVLVGFIDGDGVVATHLALGVQLVQVLDQIEYEGVVVIDHQDARHGGQRSRPSVAPGFRGDYWESDPFPENGSCGSSHGKTNWNSTKTTTANRMSAQRTRTQHSRQMPPDPR